MKKVLCLFSVLLLAAGYLFACDITTTVQDSCKKEIYNTGDTVVINVQVQLIHRNCAVAINSTKFTYENLKILGATKWKEEKTGLYVRQVKAVVTADKSGDAKLFVSRQCDKGGGESVCILKK